MVLGAVRTNYGSGVVAVRGGSYRILGSYINAWSLQQGLQALGHKAQAVPRSQYNSINSTLSQAGVLFFTDEAGWTLATQRYISAHFLPKAYNPILVDKLLFAEHLRTIGEIPVPYDSLENAQKLSFPLPCVFKPRRSWQDTCKMPRGSTCFTEQEMTQAITHLQAQGATPEMLFVQRFLKDAENLSVSGFYDYACPERQFFITTRKVMGDGGALNTGVLVETVPPPPELGTRVRRILDTLNYQGPFEMEFLHDATAAKYYVLEINPRFWMQHGLFIKGYGNILIRAYLHKPFICPLVVDAERMLPYKPMLWVDRCFLIRAFAVGAWMPLRAYFQKIREARSEGYRVCGFPRWQRVLRFAMSRLTQL